MKIRLHPTLFASLLLALASGPVLRAQEPAPTTQEAPTPKKATPRSKATAQAPKATAKPEAARPRTKGKLKPVDLNSATKEQISFMLGIDVGIAAKIVAGRPYLTKAKLLTDKIVSADVYASIKDRVYAKQGPSPK